SSSRTPTGTLWRSSSPEYHRRSAGDLPGPRLGTVAHLFPGELLLAGVHLLRLHWHASLQRVQGSDLKCGRGAHRWERLSPALSSSRTILRIPCRVANMTLRPPNHTPATAPKKSVPITAHCTSSRWRYPCSVCLL